MTEIKRDNLVLSSGVTNEITLPSGTYERGTAIGKLNGAYGAIGETGFTKDSLWCILAQKVESTGTAKTTGYFTGEYRKREIVIKGTAVAVTADDLVDPARKLGIFIK